ncbi:agamous-like protein 12 [Cinnamomum micranthum f. kanehirae]|uniref:Agamous-like protein 12 n=1 Tax=Cinnamomum micranthum f. kanehirae TaxID=337451 RepID=A0A3S3MY59_9MAGN|nr:agamous-like protein 12 [Cinnamomum micranthum f. kanehirae]
MARGKIQMRRIENPVHRQVTFCKRRAGLLKKANELSVLCDADIGLMIFSTHGKLYELATNGRSMEGLIERYRKASGGDEVGGEGNPPPGLKQEILMLKQEIELLQKGLSYISGGEMGTLTLNELHALERQLEIWMREIRSAKMEIMCQEIQLLKKKEGILIAANEFLQGKIEEQNGIFNVPPILTEIPQSLTIQNEIFQF